MMQPNTMVISSTDNNTTYSVGDGGLTQVNFTTARRDKLDGIAVVQKLMYNLIGMQVLVTHPILNKPTIPSNTNQLTNGAGYHNIYFKPSN